MQMNKTGFISYTKINLNIRPETVKVQEENIEGKLLNMDLGNVFSFYNKSKGNKSTNKQVRLHQIRKLPPNKGDNQQSEKAA